MSIRSLASTVAFAGAVAAIVVVVGTRDVESYDHAFFSLDRGTAMDSVRVLGHPVYTLALGLGVRLPLHGSLGASPAAIVAPYLPAPITYWLLLMIAIASAALVVRHALEPIGGRLISWLSLVLLFCSVPIVNYTIFDDWPETAVTYCAFVACVFAPHALLSLHARQVSSSARRLGTLAIAALAWGLIGLAHPGYWPLLAVTLVLSAALALCRSEHGIRTRLTTIALLGVVAILAVAPQVPDFLRELTAGGAIAIGPTRRAVQGSTGSLVAANAFPIIERLDARLPFSHLVLALVSLAIGLTSADRRFRNLAAGAATISVVLGVAASAASAPTWRYAPSTTWALRDPAVIFAVFAGACAAIAARRPRERQPSVGRVPALTVLMLAGLQGPMYAAQLLTLGIPPNDDRWSWNQDLTAPAERLVSRGFSPEGVIGGRLAFWPEVRDEMRRRRHATVDFADGGYPLITAWTKQRTMRHVVEPNDFLFDQEIELSPQRLCDARAISLLQLRYLLLPADVACAAWQRLPDMRVDGWLHVAVPEMPDHRAWTLPVVRLIEAGRAPALSPGTPLLVGLVPLPGSWVTIDSVRAVIGLDDPSQANGQALVLPVAYDPALRASSGRVHNAGGLVALVGVDQRRVAVEFVPDLTAVARALSMTLGQVLTAGGLLAAAWLQPSLDTALVAS